MSDDLALAVEEALEHLGHAAELVEFAYRETGDEYLRRRALAQLQGRESGWLSEGVSDQLRCKPDALLNSTEVGECRS